MTLTQIRCLNCDQSFDSSNLDSSTITQTSADVNISLDLSTSVSIAYDNGSPQIIISAEDKTKIESNFADFTLKFSADTINGLQPILRDDDLDSSISIKDTDFAKADLTLGQLFSGLIGIAFGDDPKSAKVFQKNSSSSSDIPDLFPDLQNEFAKQFVDNLFNSDLPNLLQTKEFTKRRPNITSLQDILRTGDKLIIPIVLSGQLIPNSSSVPETNYSLRTEITITI